MTATSFVGCLLLPPLRLWSTAPSRRPQLACNPLSSDPWLEARRRRRSLLRSVVHPDRDDFAPRRMRASCACFAYFFFFFFFRPSAQFLYPPASAPEASSPLFCRNRCLVRTLFEVRRPLSFPFDISFSPRPTGPRGSPIARCPPKGPGHAAGPPPIASPAHSSPPFIASSSFLLRASRRPRRLIDAHRIPVFFSLYFLLCSFRFRIALRSSRRAFFPRPIQL